MNQQICRRLFLRTNLRRLLFAAAGMMSVVAVISCGGGDVLDTGVAPFAATVEVTAATTTISPEQTLQLTAVARTSTGAIAAGAPGWSSSANAVATVNSSGLVTAVGPGTVTITATYGSVSGNVALTVVPAGGTVVSLAVTLSDAALVIGDLGQATLAARDANNAPVALGNRVISWNSTNVAAATVSANGVISTVGIGTTQIRATVSEGGNNVVGNATLTVVPNPDAKQTVDVSMPGLTFSPTDVVVKVGGTVRFIFPNMDHNVIWRPLVTGSPADIPILSNQTVSRTFPTVGVFPYVCTLHNGMVGTVVVSP